MPRRIAHLSRIAGDRPSTVRLRLVFVARVHVAMQVRIGVPEHRVIDLDGLRHSRDSLPKDHHVFQEGVPSRTSELVKLLHVVTSEEERVAA